MHASFYNQLYSTPTGTICFMKYVCGTVCIACNTNQYITVN